jgi:hypothetical protein
MIDINSLAMHYYLQDLEHRAALSVRRRALLDAAVPPREPAAGRETAIAAVLRWVRLVWRPAGA